MDPEDPESDRKETLDSTRRAVSVAFHGIHAKNLLTMQCTVRSMPCPKGMPGAPRSLGPGLEHVLNMVTWNSGRSAVISARRAPTVAVRRLSVGLRGLVRSLRSRGVEF